MSIILLAMLTRLVLNGGDSLAWIAGVLHGGVLQDIIVRKTSFQSKGQKRLLPIEGKIAKDCQTHYLIRLVISCWGETFMR